MVIWKFPLLSAESQKIVMPKGAQILSIGTQDGYKMSVWAMVDTETVRVQRCFRIFGTGHPILLNEHEVVNFVGTVMLDGLGLVFHVWDCGEIE